MVETVCFGRKPLDAAAIVAAAASGSNVANGESKDTQVSAM